MQTSKLIDQADIFGQALQAVNYCGSWYSDHVSGLIQLSPEARLLMPFTDRELAKPILASRFDAVLHPDDRAWLQTRRAKPVAGGVVRSIVEYRVVGREGVRWIQAHSMRRSRDDGTPIDGRGMSFDITDLKEAGDSVYRNPLAPMSKPLNHLAEGVLLALAAAEQARLPGVAGALRKIASTTGRLLARDISNWTWPH